MGYYSTTSALNRIFFLTCTSTITSHHKHHHKPVQAPQKALAPVPAGLDKVWKNLTKTPTIWCRLGLIVEKVDKKLDKKGGRGRHRFLFRTFSPLKIRRRNSQKHLGLDLYKAVADLYKNQYRKKQELAPCIDCKGLYNVFYKISTSLYNLYNNYFRGREFSATGTIRLLVGLARYCTCTNLFRV